MNNSVPGSIKTQFLYIHFVQLPGRGSTSVWSCRNTDQGNELGVVKWNCVWRQYCYFPAVQTIYSVGCMRDIIEFIGLVTEAWSLAREAKKRIEGHHD